MVATRSRHHGSTDTPSEVDNNQVSPPQSEIERVQGLEPPPIEPSLVDRDQGLDPSSIASSSVEQVGVHGSEPTPTVPSLVEQGLVPSSIAPSSVEQTRSGNFIQDNCMPAVIAFANSNLHAQHANSIAPLPQSIPIINHVSPPNIMQNESEAQIGQPVMGPNQIVQPVMEPNQIVPQNALSQMVSQRIAPCLQIIQEIKTARVGQAKFYANRICRDKDSEHKYLHCPIKHQGEACPRSFKYMSEWYKHVQLEHINSAAKDAITRIMTEADMAQECDHCNASWSIWGYRTHNGKCKKQDATKNLRHAAIPEQIHRDLTLEAVQNWPWDKLSEDNTREICQPGLVCNPSIHQHIMSQLTPILAALYDAAANGSIQPDVHMRATIFLLQAISCHPKHEKAKLQLTIQQARLRLFKSGQWDKLRGIIAERILDNETRRSKSDIIKDTRSATINGGKVRSTVLAEDQPHIVSPTEFEKLKQSQFPPKPQDAEPLVQLPQIHLAIIEDRLHNTLSSMSSAVGPTAISAHIWRQVYDAHKETVIKFIQRIITNTVPPCSREVLTGVNYSVLKRTNADKLRAVGSMDALVKIAAKYMDSSLKVQRQQLIEGTTEYAVGTKYATAKIATRLFTAIKKNENNPKFAIMKIDIKAAYPSASRHHMMKEIQGKIPEMAGLFGFLYGQSNKHHIVTTQGPRSIDQEWGLIQGAESSSFFFSLLTQSKLDDPMWSQCLLRYVDDFFLFGEIQDLQDHYKTLKDKYKEIGLQFAQDKTKIFIPHASPDQRQEINSNLMAELQQNREQLEEQGIKILGIPIGSEDWVKQKLSCLINQYESDLEIIKSHCSNQQIFKVLQLSASVFQHIIAVIPPDITDEFCTQIDDINREHFKQLCMSSHIQLTDQQREWLNDRLHLPVRHNGMGLLALKYRNRPAFISTAAAIYNDKASASIASWEAYTSSSMKQHLENAMDFIHQWRVMKITRFNSMASDQNQQPIPQPRTFEEISKQRMDQWLQPLFETLVGRLMTNANPRQLQLLTAMENKATRIILTAWPNRPATRLNNDQMNHALCHRLGVGLKELLGMDIESVAAKCQGCKTGTLMAEHMNSCPSSRIERHDTIVTCTQAMLDDAGLHGVIEKPVGTANLDQQGNRKKIDIWFRNQSPTNVSQTHVMVDVTVIQAFSTKTSEIPDTVKLMKTAATKKRVTYANEARALSAVVQPLVFNTLGAMHAEVDSFIKGMAKFAEQNQTYYPSVDFNFNVKWRQNFAFQIARSTANAAYKAMRIHSSNTTLVSQLHRLVN